MSMFIGSYRFVWGMLAISICFLVFAQTCKSDEATGGIVKGLFISYEGAEYENVFVQCSTGNVWLVDGGDAFEELVDLYKISTLSKYGELFVELKGDLYFIDKAKFPRSHYVGVIHVSKLVASSSNRNAIKKCRAR